MNKNKNIWLITFLINISLFTLLIKAQEYTLMLVPSYSSQGGRIIEGNFENSIATQWATALRHELINQMPDIQVLLAHQQDEDADSAEIINRVNRSKPDLVISLNLFPHVGIPQVYLYYMLYNPTIDPWKPKHGLSFTSYDQAYQVSLSSTKATGDKIVKYLQNNKPNTYELKNLLGVPYKPLIGLQVPAIGLELGTPHSKGWELTLTSLVQAIKNLMPPTVSQG